MCSKPRQREHELDTGAAGTSAIASDASHAVCCLQDGRSALMFASICGHIAVADRLIAAGAKLDLQDMGVLAKEQGKQLKEAAGKGDHEALALLLEAGADINWQDIDGYSALINASAYGHIVVADRLIAAGANLDLQNKNGDSALMYASQNGHTEAADRLIAAGAKLDLQSKVSKRLHAAACHAASAHHCC